MTTPRKPLWAKGLALLPQHFQFQDRYHEDLLAFRLDAVVDHAFGVADMQLDEVALARGELRLERLRALFPDGTVVDVTEPTIPSRALDPNRAEPVDVFLGLTKHGLERGGSLPPRMVTERTHVADQLTGLATTEVEWLRPYPILLLSTDHLPSFDVLPLARIARAPTGEPIVVADLVPPLLRLRASTTLHASLRRVRQALLSAANTIAAQRARSKDLDGPAAARLILSSLFATSVARIGAVLDRPNARPSEAYDALIELVGGLSAFDPSVQLGALPAYQHTDLASTFAPLVQQAVRTLARLAASRAVLIPLRSSGPSLHFADLVEPAMFRHEFYIALSGADEARLREIIPQVMKVSAWEAMEELVRSAASGVRVAHEHRPPPVLPLRPGVVYFRIERAGAHWENIVRRGNLTILQPHEPATVKIELYAVEPEGGP